MKKKLGLIGIVSLSAMALFGAIKTNTSVAYAEEIASSEPVSSEVVETNTEKTIKDFVNEFVSPILIILASVDVVAILGLIIDLATSKKRENRRNENVSNTVSTIEKENAKTIGKVVECIEQIKDMLPVIDTATKTCIESSEKFVKTVEELAERIKNNTATVDYLTELYSVLISIQKNVATNTKELVSNGAAEKICALISNLKDSKNEK